MLPVQNRSWNRVFLPLLSAASLLSAAALTVPATALVGHNTTEQTPQSIEVTANRLLAQMTLPEKIKMLSGTQDEMHIPGLARLNIPELKFSDGPVGVRCWGKSTAYPCGAMLAASWDVALAGATGKSLGRDSRARGVHVLLGPGVDLYRVPQCGRNFEYFGEDPYLSAALTTSWVRGLQSQGVAACVKHFAANDQEIQRDSINTIVDERRLHEICLPPFKAAVEKGNAWTLMAAYNKLNGPWCTANSYLLTDVLRNQWGFKGILMSDWGAVHEGLGPLKAGTDLEMGKTKYYTEDAIRKFIASGKLKESDINEHVRRILRTSLSMGFFNRAQEDKSIPANDPASAATALRIAREGLVLLKNQNNVLPLDRTKNHKIVVIGPNAVPAVTGGGGSSYTEPFNSVSLLDAISNAGGSAVEVSLIPTWIGADPTATSSFNNKGFYEKLPGAENRGLRAEYFNNPDLSGEPALTRVDSTVNFMWDKWKPDNAITSDKYSVRWSGKFRVPQTDQYTLAYAGDGARVMLDGQPLFDNWKSGKLEKQSKNVSFKRGETHDVSIEYRHVNGPARMQFTWAKATPAFTPEETKELADADAVIASIGFNSFLESEGFDRSFGLPHEQVELLKRAAQANPKIIAVLNAGGNVGMNNWYDSVSGLIHAWYPGQNGNVAVAEAIFGDLNPSGRLPDTFETAWEDSPAHKSYPGDAANGGTVKYDEGIYVGYRWFDKKHVQPRFPFGYGLSYTNFAMKNMSVARNPRGYEVAFDVTNTGPRTGATVVQLYTSALHSSVDRPVKELKGFERVQLNPGQTQRVKLLVDKNAFAYYDARLHKWVSEPGQYKLSAGFSSADLRESKTVAL